MNPVYYEYDQNNMHTQYCKINQQWCILISEEEANSNKEDNIYYLHWVTDWLEKRASDTDIDMKDYFVLDLDMRNAIPDISNEDIINEWKNLVEHLWSEHEFFWEWSKIVFSWNWLHIYYSWDLRYFDKQVYSTGVEEIYSMWDQFMWDPVWSCDHACKNIARILRLPGSVNQKNWAEVTVVSERDKKSRLFNNIEKLSEKRKTKLLEEEKNRKEHNESVMKLSQWSDGGVYEKINSIPAYQVAMMLVPEFPYDWKKNFKNKKWWLTWYFYCSETNSICNWWSRYFNWWTSTSCWNNFSMVKNQKDMTDKETFTFFKKILWQK